MLWDSGALDMSFRIMIEKIMLVLHIRSLSEDTLAKKIYLEQIGQNWPGLQRKQKKFV